MKILSTAPNRPRRRFARALVAFAAAAIILGAAPASAMAAETHTAAQTVVVETVASTVVAPSASTLAVTAVVAPKTDLTGCYKCADEGPATAKSKLIPINRWTSATTQLHFRQNGNDPIGLAAATVRIGTQQGLLSWTAAIWSGTAWLTDFASTLSPINALGLEIDKATASMGKALFQAPLIFTLLGIGVLLGALWNKSRGRDATGMLKRAASVVLVMIAIGSMANGAGNSKDVGGTYVPGIASPGWIITEIHTLVGAGTSAALSSVNAGAFATPTPGTNINPNSQLSCSLYTSNMHEIFAANSDGTGASISAMSLMWETSGLSTWANAQFGANNDYVSQVWCHRADHLAGTTRKKQLDYTLLNVTGADTLRQMIVDGKWKSKALYTDNEVDDDRTMIGWAACNWNGKDFIVQKAFQKRLADDGSTTKEWITPNDCKAWWSGTNVVSPSGVSDDGQNLETTGMNIGTGEQGQQKLGEMTDDAGVKDFASSWQGTDVGLGSTTIIFWSIIAGLVLLVILGFGLSGAVAISKLLTVMVMMTLILVLIGSLFSKEGPGARIAQTVKQLIGYTVLASGASALFIIITWMTQLLISLGVKTAGAGSVPALIWTALAPILAMIVLHKLFKKFNLPSPLSPKGALAWGAAGGAAGGIIGSGLASRLGNRAKNVAGKAMEGKGSSLLHSATRGKFGEAAQGASRSGAGAPPVAGKSGAKTNPKQQAKDVASDQLNAATQYARANDIKIPETAGQRANRQVLGTLKGVKTGLVNGHEVTRQGLRYAFTEEGNKKVGKAIKSTAARSSAALKHNLSKEEIQKRVASNNAATAEKLKHFAKNPVTDSWAGVTKVGRGVKATAGVTGKVAGYAGLGLLAASTGGVSLVPTIAVMGGKKAIGTRNNRRAEQADFVSKYQDHLKTEAKNEAAQVKYHEKVGRKAAEVAAKAAASSASSGAATSSGRAPASPMAHGD